ncbi:MAG: hypothetical protein WA190_15765 [Usitatibacter sp.]
MGRAGPAGGQGVTGSTGAQGPTTYGPTGPAGPAGVAGAQGVTGSTGAQGKAELAGVSGPTGFSGTAGPQGAVGQTGAQGPAGAMNVATGWTFYRDFTFAGRSDDIVSSDSDKARQIADYSRKNPSNRIAIDGMNQRYVHSVYDALVDAGVPAGKIETGTYRNPQSRHDHEVVVLVSN